MDFKNAAWGVDSRPYILLQGLGMLLKGSLPAFMAAALMREEELGQFSPFLSEGVGWIALIYFKW